MTSSFFQTLHSSFLSKHQIDLGFFRLDIKHSHYSGNKDYKLRYLDIGDAKTIVSLGGAWSNHLLALSRFALDRGLQSVAMVRSEDQRLNPLLAQCVQNGMRLHWLNFSEYRARHGVAFQDQVRSLYPNAYFLPEGGASTQAIQGCRDIGIELNSGAPAADVVVVAVGTGATLAGLCLGLRADQRVLGVPVTPKFAEQQRYIESVVEGQPHARWCLERTASLGKYGKLSDTLVNFIRRFEAEYGIPLDPNYTAKAVYHVFEQIRAGKFAAGSRVVVVHTGGLIGRLGYPQITDTP